MKNTNMTINIKSLPPRRVVGGYGGTKFPQFYIKLSNVFYNTYYNIYISKKEVAHLRSPPCRFS